MSKKRKRRRPFPIIAGSPGDDDTIIYKISGSGGDFLVGGETVFISDQGIQVVASLSGDYDDQHAYTFVDDDGYDVGGLYARDDAGQNILGLRAVDPPAKGDDIVLQIAATAEPSGDSTAEAKIVLVTERSGETTDTYIQLRKDNNDSQIDLACTERVRIAPAINLLGASLELCDLYIKGTKFIIKYNDGGTIRFKYLDLSGTGATWSHSTVEP